jgi:hypothetical protein
MSKKEIKFIINEVTKITDCVVGKEYKLPSKYSKIEIEKPFIGKQNFYDDLITLNQRNEYYNNLSRIAKELGMDALAWYLPYHFYPKDWGIYIPKESICFIAEEYLGESSYENLNIAYKVLLHHENYHFLNEFLVSKWELRLDGACYKYNTYPRGQYNKKEECLANAHMLKSIKNFDEGAIKKIKDFCSNQPPGYRDFYSVHKKSDEKIAQLKLLKEYIGLSALEINPRINDWSSQLDLDFYPQDKKSCRVFLLEDRNVSGSFNQLEFITKIEDISESKKFQKNLKKYNLEIKWKKIKEQVNTSITGKLKFRKFPKNSKDIFSLNVDNGHRAHIKKYRKSWEAIDIGPHTKMGHG